MNQTPKHKYVLIAIVFAQFAGTSMWFAGNAVMSELSQVFGLGDQAIGTTTAAVQLGFIVGTLIYAFANVADRFDPRRVFLISAICGAIFNYCPVLFEGDKVVLYISRICTGFFLAGIYPVGMKIAAQWYKKDLGKALGFLVGALVLGTAFPHFLKAMDIGIEWKVLLSFVSVLTVFGAFILFFATRDSPHNRSKASFRTDALLIIFKERAFRSAAFGYFGHMWELYAFWAFVPLILLRYTEVGQVSNLPISLWSFLIISFGTLGCIWGGYWSKKFSSGWVAFVTLSISACCCVLAYIAIHASTPVFLAFMLLWGMTVVADSPQFSTLNALTAPAEWMGSALTITTSIGFSITIISIQLMNTFVVRYPIEYFLWILAIGPLLGIRESWKLKKLNL